MKEKYIPTPEESIKATSMMSREEEQATRDRVKEKLKIILGNIIEGVKIGEVGREKLISDIDHCLANKPIPNVLAFVGLKDELNKIFQIDLIDKDTITAYQQMDDLFPNLSKEERIAQLKKTDPLLLDIASNLIHYNIQVKKRLAGMKVGLEGNDLSYIGFFKPLYNAKTLHKFRDVVDNYYKKIFEPGLSPKEFDEYAKKKDELFQMAIKEIAKKSLAGWDRNKEKYEERSTK